VRPLHPDVPIVGHHSSPIPYSIRFGRPYNSSWDDRRTQNIFTPSEGGGAWTYLLEAVCVVGPVLWGSHLLQSSYVAHVTRHWGQVGSRVWFRNGCAAGRSWVKRSVGSVFSSLAFKRPARRTSCYHTLLTFIFLAPLPSLSCHSRNRVREREDREKRKEEEGRAELPFLTHHRLPPVASQFDGVVVRIKHLAGALR
jgi:hypothetical protein